MNIDELIKWCNYLYEEDTKEGELSDDDWIRLFNSAINDARILKYIKIDWWVTTPIQPNISDYGLPDEFLREMYIGVGKSQSQHKLTELKRLSMLDFTGCGYKMKNHNREIQIQPIPTTAGEYLHMYMEGRPKDIEDIEREIEIQDPYILGHHALYQAEIKNKAFDKARQHWAELIGRANSLEDVKRNHPRHVMQGKNYD